jgi:hypothetical protein
MVLPGEELVKVSNDDLFQPHEPVVVGNGAVLALAPAGPFLEGNKARQGRRHLDAGEVVLVLLGVA